MGFKLIRADINGATAEVKAVREFTDELHHVTGGLYTSLADFAGSAAANAGDDFYVTQNCSMQFYSSTEVSDGCLIAEAHVRHRGSRTCIVAVELKHENGEVVSDGQFSYSKVTL